MRIGKQTFIGLFLDLFDWAVVGLIPFLGDIVDLIAAFYWYRKIGWAGAIAAVEILPVFDVLPTNIALGLYADNKGGKKK